MRKTSLSGSSVTGSGAYLEAVASLTAAMQDLQAAMSALAGVLQTTSSGAPEAGVEPDYYAGRRQPPKNISSHGAERAAQDDMERQRMALLISQRAAAGEPGASEERDVTEEIDRPATYETKAAAAISHGMEDYLPALSANRPPAFTRYDSVQLGSIWHDAESKSEEGWEDASSALARRGHHLGGLDDLGGPDGPNGMNTASTQRLEDAIGRLTEAILHGSGRSGSALHPGEAQGGLNGLLQAARLPARPDGYN